MSPFKRLIPLVCCIAAGTAWTLGCGDDPKSSAFDETDSGTGGSSVGAGGGTGAGGRASTGGTGAGGRVGTGGASAGGAGAGGASAGGAPLDAGSGGAPGAGGAGDGGSPGGGGTSPDAGVEGGLGCGNDVLEAGEECEPPNTASCDANCQLGGACTACEEANCGGAAIHEACTDTSSDPDACIAALACSRQPYDPDGSGPLPVQANCYVNGQADCYCGAQIDVNDCETGTTAAAGPCVVEYEAIAGASPTQAQVLARLGDDTFDLGDVGIIQLCDQSFCTGECF